MSLRNNPLLQNRRKTKKITEAKNAFNMGEEDLENSPSARGVMQEEEILTEDQKNRSERRMLTRINPAAPHNLMVYSFKESSYKKIDDVSQLIVHYSLAENILKKDSENSDLQATFWDLRNNAEDRMIKELNEGITYEKSEHSQQDLENEKKKSLRNQFNFSDRAAGIIGNKVKMIGGKTKPPPPQDSNEEVCEADIFDEFLHYYESELIKRQEEDRRGDKSESMLEKKKTIQEDILHSAEMKKSLKIMERVMIENYNYSIYSDYKYWVDDTDSSHATVLPLWRIYYSKTLRKQVTSICWNPKYRDLFAVGYGSYEFQKNISTGAICVFTLKNPSHPEYYYETPSDVMCLDFHPQHPALIAVGLYNGTVMVYDIRIKGVKNNPIYQSTVRTKKHTDPVWEVHWNKKVGTRELSFFSISSDGRITKWTLMKNKLEPEDLIRLKMVAPPTEKGETRIDLDEEMALSGYAGGMCFSFNKFNDHLFLVGTEEGRIHLCSVDFSGDYLRSYRGHYLAVYAVKWNPYHPDVFLSCSADWTIKLWTKNRETPLATFELNASVSDVQWAPYSSTIFAAVCANSTLYVYNLNKDKHNSICEQKIVKKMQPTHVAFNPFDPILITGEDKGGCGSYRLSGGLLSDQPGDPKTPAERQKEMNNFLESLDKELYQSFLDTSHFIHLRKNCLLYTSPSPRDLSTSRMPSSA
eukprot:TRINITY_DN3871_c0_g2_i4.p1 TRINITY_DN3871_c0_g2~~TRINITY_DN3871_c0_g2_i4.p1  ORF type:complete len:767 (+),score=141.83 TRINITY_DN3871_c0_g2_i4:212-2302(+)